MAATRNSPDDAGDLINFDDGTQAVVRPMFPTDPGTLLRFHGHLSASSVWLRYFSPHNDVSSSEVARFTQVDGEARVAFVVGCASELVALVATTGSTITGRRRWLSSWLTPTNTMDSPPCCCTASPPRHHRLVVHASQQKFWRRTGRCSRSFILPDFHWIKTEWGTVELMMTIALDLTETATD
jgi:hypothetical protein